MAIAKDSEQLPEGKQLKHWIVQKWNGEEFVDTITVHPGEKFEVKEENAKVIVGTWATPKDEDDEEYATIPGN